MKKLLKPLCQIGMILALSMEPAFAIPQFFTQQTGQVSSLMWQPNLKYVYFPGIPAVLRPSAGAQNREFVIEQYFSNPIHGEQLIPIIRGTWPDLREYRLAPASNDPRTLRNRYMQVSVPECDALPVRVTIERSEKSLYRCITRFSVQPSTPTGTIGISMTYVKDEQVVNHTNSVFWIIIPEERNLQTADASKASSELTHTLTKAPAISWDDTEIDNYVVQLNLGGNLSLGSGFITRDISHMLPFFPRKIPALSSQDDVYIVTAAHLFPISYVQARWGRGPDRSYLIDNSELAIQAKDYVYNIRVRGYLVRDAADLVAQNIESDLAVLKLRPVAKNALVDYLNLRSTAELKGLTFANSVDIDSNYLALGYPVKHQRSDLVKRIGFLKGDGYPTEETSNFGPVHKFKLDAPSLLSTSLAEPGMSGGPVLNAVGEVIGIATERPNASNLNSLVGIDLTTEAERVIAPHRNSWDCMLQFNPFDRLLVIRNYSPDCRYGSFGSQTLSQEPDLQPLRGEWVVQEVLGFAQGNTKDTTAAYGQRLINGTGIINGTAIINGTGIINGTAIINGTGLITGSEIISGNLEEINKLFTNGFRLNADSFENFVPVGVRVLKNPYEKRMTEDSYLGHLILGIKRNGPAEPVSVRKFAIWLHMNPRYEDLVKVP